MCKSPHGRVWCVIPYYPKSFHVNRHILLSLAQMFQTRAVNLHSCERGWNSSVDSVFGSLSCMMQHRRFNSSQSLPVEGNFPLELTWVLTPCCVRNCVQNFLQKTWIVVNISDLLYWKYIILSYSLKILTVKTEVCVCTYLLTYAPCSQWSIGHQRPPAIALCSGLLVSFRTSWSPVFVSALLQCLASNCCEAGLSSSSLAGSRSGFGMWCWMLASWGCVRSSPTSSAVSPWPLVPVPLAPTVLHFGSSLAIGFCRCASDRCWRMSGSFVASSVLSAMSHIRKAGLTSHWSWRCGVWFSCWFFQMPRCFWAWRKLLLPCRFWLWRLGLCLPDGQPHFPDRQRTPPPFWALHQLWLVRWQLCSSSSAQSSFCWSWALSLLMWSQQTGLVLHLAVIVWQERQVISEVEVV